MKKTGWLRIALIAGGVITGVILAGLVTLFIFGSAGMTGRQIMNDGDLAMPGSRASYGASDWSEEKAVEEAPMQPAAEVASTVPGLAYAAERLIIRSGNISMVVEDTRTAKANIEDMVAGMVSEGAFIVSSQEYGSTEENQPYVTISIRVPAIHFDRTMDRLADMAVQVTNRNESADDVTEEYVDLEARLESLEAARQRLLEIMQEARSTKDLLEAEQQLTQREAEIESIKGRMQYLEESAKLSSIWIELQPYILSQPVSDEWRPAETARRAQTALLDGLQGFGEFMIFFAIAVLPWLLAIAVVAYIIVRLVRWRARARRAKRPAADQTSD